jgi:hypothetical protein
MLDVADLEAELPESPISLARKSVEAVRPAPASNILLHQQTVENGAELGADLRCLVAVAPVE